MMGLFVMWGRVLRKIENTKIWGRNKIIIIIIIIIVTKILLD
jgi:hypothetical protein